jgi:hypothetical protein
MTDRLDVRWFFLAVALAILLTGFFFRRQVRNLPQQAGGA